MTWIESTEYSHRVKQGSIEQVRWKIDDHRGQSWAVSTTASSLLTGTAEASEEAKEGALWSSLWQRAWWIEGEGASMAKSVVG